MSAPLFGAIPAIQWMGVGLGGALTTFALAGGAVVALYLLKLRRRRVAVPFVRLWEQILAEKQSTRLFSQLKRLLSLLIALSVVAALAAALGDPRPDAAARAGRSLFVLVDASASMRATGGEGETSRISRARAEVARLIRELGPEDRMLIAQLDESATPLSPWTDEPRVLEAALEELALTDLAANPRAGLRLALDGLRGKPQPEVVLVSDGGLDDVRFALGGVGRQLAREGVRLSWIPVGEDGENVGVTAFAVRRYPLDKSQTEVLVELTNFTDEVRAVELSLLGDGAPVEVQSLEIPPGEPTRRFFRNISGIDERLEARITPAATEASPMWVDHLPTDDHAFALLPERRRARVLVVSEGNLYLQAALLLDEYLDVVEATPATYPDHDALAGFDVLIFDGWLPDAPPPRAALYLNPVPREGAFPLFATGDEPHEVPWFAHLDRHHPLLRFTALGDVNISSSLDVELERGDRAIGRGEQGEPLLVTGTREGSPFVALTFDVRGSDLPLRVAWPLLLLNAIDTFVQDAAGYVSSYSTGDVWRIPAPAARSRVDIIDPRGEEHSVPVERGRAVFAGQHAGFYELHADDQRATFAANLGAPEEGALAIPDELTLSGLSADEPSAGEPGARREPWVYLVLFALGVLIAEWYSYHRRMTV